MSNAKKRCFTDLGHLTVNIEKRLNGNAARLSAPNFTKSTATGALVYRPGLPRAESPFKMKTKRKEKGIEEERNRKSKVEF